MLNWRKIEEIIILSVSLVMIYGALIYYFYALNWLSISFILALSVFSAYKLIPLIYPPLKSLQPNKTTSKKLNIWARWPLLIYLILWLFSLYTLKEIASDRPLISPWEIVPIKFFGLYALSALSLIIIFNKKQLSTLEKKLSLSSFYFLSFGVAVLVYKISYGYDPFIHGATMELISEQGAVLPKPFYYLGQYSLLVIIHKISGLSLYFLNKFLVPISAAFILPWAAYRLSLFNQKKYLPDLKLKTIFLSSLFLLSLGFSPFIISVPQSFSYLFLIITITLGLTKKNLLGALISALATLAIHPLTGLPALIWLAFLYLKKISPSLSLSKYKCLKFILSLSGALALPLAFLFSGANNLKGLSWRVDFLLSPITNLLTWPNLAGQENWLLNLIYIFGHNYNLWLLALLIVSWFFYHHRKNSRTFNSLLSMNWLLIISYFLSSQIIFTNVINYEQTNFANRILTIIVIFSLPFILLLFNKAIGLILKKGFLTRLIFLIAGISLLMISLYISYPRFDNYYNARGYSTSSFDIQAVRLIDTWATKPYIVLANQQVSVAALKELGFDNYHQSDKGQFFFYPIPTGGPLYQFYLDMVYKKPDQVTMAKARKLVGVSESFLVINKYWHQSEQIINEAKLEADAWKNIDNEIYIFQYLEKPAK